MNHLPNATHKIAQCERTMEHLSQCGRQDMHYQRSAMNEVGRSGRRFSGDAALPALVAPRPRRRPGSDGRSSRKPRSGTAWLALILGLALPPAVGWGQTVEWARSAGGTHADLGFGIAVDAAGNSHVTGRFDRPAVFGPFTLAWVGGSDVFVAKYDSSGNVLWAQSAGGTTNEEGHGIAVDAAGNIYVTGWFRGTANFGPFTLTSAGSADIFVAKYDGVGNVLWARSAGGTSGLDWGTGIAVDAAGNSYVTGWYTGVATFGSFTLTEAGSNDIFLAKYDANGTVLWARSAGGTMQERAYGIAVGAAGDSYVTGFYNGTATFGSFQLTSTGESDIFVAKYDGSGNVLWARSGGGPSFDNGNSIGTDDAGNSYVTGEITATSTFGSFMITSAGERDIFVAKYDTGGNVIWARSGGGTSADIGFGIAVDAAGNSFLTGVFSDAATFGSFTLTGAGGDIFVAKYGGSGNVLWAQSAGGTSQDLGLAIAVDAAGDSYVTGYYVGTAMIGPFTFTSAGANEIFVAKYAASECDNGSVDPGEQCDGGLGCTDCLCDTDFEPTTSPSLDCQPTCGNGSVDPGEECDGMDDTACPGACLSDCTCSSFCGNGVCGPGEDSCNCPDDCGTPPTSETPGANCSDGLDNDCDGDADCDDADCEGDCQGVPSPTVSEWGMTVLIMALLAGIALKFRRSRTT